MRRIVPPSALSGQRTGPLLALLAAGIALAGCNLQSQHVSAGLPSDGYRSNYPITIQEAPEVLDIPVGRGSAGLSPDLAAVVHSYGVDAAHNATSGVAIMVPQGSANASTAAYLGRDIARILKTSGLSASLVEQRRYAVADPAANAPIRLTFNRIKAVSPPCGRWTGNIMPDDGGSNDGSEFGCSTQANLAAMVENPNDLIIPRAQTPIPAWKRWKSLQNYESGTSSSSSSSSSSSN